MQTWEVNIIIPNGQVRKLRAREFIFLACSQPAGKGESQGQIRSEQVAQVGTTHLTPGQLPVSR